MTTNQKANQVKYPTKDWHDGIVGKNCYVLSSNPRTWEAEAKAAIPKMHMLLVHPTYLVDLLASLDATRRENEDLKRRFKDAVEKLMKV